MTEAELQELLHHHPRLWHMAEAGSWPSIRENGLLSTSALLDRFGVEGAARAAIEAARRPRSVPVPGAPDGVVVRDNGPLNEKRLAACLSGDLQPEDWYRLLNGRVFFWPSRERLETLMRAYAGQVHDVIEVATAELIAAHGDRIELSPINSGATGRAAAPRGPDTFRSIDAYDYAHWRARRSRGKRIAEVTVVGGVPDIGRLAVRVVRMRDGVEEGAIWEREPGA